MDLFINNNELFRSNYLDKASEPIQFMSCLFTFFDLNSVDLDLHLHCDGGDCPAPCSPTG